MEGDAGHLTASEACPSIAPSVSMSASQAHPLPRGQVLPAGLDRTSFLHITTHTSPNSDLNFILRRHLGLRVLEEACVLDGRCASGNKWTEAGEPVKPCCSDLLAELFNVSTPGLPPPNPWACPAPPRHMALRFFQQYWGRLDHVDWFLCDMHPAVNFLTYLPVVCFLFYDCFYACHRSVSGSWHSASPWSSGS